MDLGAVGEFDGEGLDVLFRVQEHQAKILGGHVEELRPLFAVFDVLPGGGLIGRGEPDLGDHSGGAISDVLVGLHVGRADPLDPG